MGDASTSLAADSQFSGAPTVNDDTLGAESRMNQLMESDTSIRLRPQRLCMLFGYKFLRSEEVLPPAGDVEQIPAFVGIRVLGSIVVPEMMVLPEMA